MLSGNRQSLLIYSVIAGLFLAIMFVASFLIEEVEPHRFTYLKLRRKKFAAV